MFPGFQNQIPINRHNGENIHENSSIYSYYHQSSDSPVFNGFHTNSSTSEVNQESRTEQNGFTGFHVQSSSPITPPPARNVTDNARSNSSMNNEALLQEQYGISQSQPKHPQFAVKSVRLSSFRSFPTGISQTPEDLAQAGFFYSGKEDIVFCFFCGQGLKSWEPNDDVWIEHARWAPDCVHLLNCKGREFVRMVQLADTDPEQPNPATHNGFNTSNGNEAAESRRETVDGHPGARIDRVLTSSTARSNSELLGTVAAMSVTSNGYDEDLVLKAINVFLHRQGRSDFNATDLLQIIFELEEGSIKYEEVVSEQKQCQPEAKSEQLVRKQTVDTPDALGKSNADMKMEAKSLMEENRQLKDQTICKICLEEIVSIVFLPCGHLCCCSQCAPALRKCPICRGFIKGTVKTYLI